MPTPWQVEQARGGRLDEAGELVVEAGAVGVDVDARGARGSASPAWWRTRRGHRRVRAQRRGGLGEGADGDATEPFPQLIGGAEAEMAELVEALDAGVASGAVGDEQHPDRFDVAIGGLGHAVGAAAQRRSSGLDGIDAVGLAVAATGLTVRAIDLDHRHPVTAQEAGQAGPVGAGALHPDPLQRAERASQACSSANPAVVVGNDSTPSTPPLAVERGGDVNVEVGVDPAGDRTRLYDGHGHPFSVQVVKGWHARPGKETVTIGLRLTGRSITLRNGACPCSSRQPGRQASRHARCHQSVRPEPSSR